MLVSERSASSFQYKAITCLPGWVQAAASNHPTIQPSNHPTSQPATTSNSQQEEAEASVRGERRMSGFSLQFNPVPVSLCGILNGDTKATLVASG
ncbi:hypothetical protein M0802_005833 [Mischocyttarus mexicanus]|nr:hypothetical protein M0802_005833 [Mischocyttarus mexicanus]